MMMMLHHNHHHCPLSQPFDNDPSVAENDGPTHTTYMSNHINLVTATGSYSALGASAGASAGAGATSSVPVRPFQQPSDISAYYTSGITTYPAFKSSADVMAASMGFPFTSAQWKELERQAMIYKYMMASVPVPPDLLISTASHSILNGGLNLRLSSSDSEPGRCRRTDGKKWRCSRDVAPNHKYCERHMHRGRSRSRKPVEVHTKNNQNQIKMTHHDCNPFPISDVSVAIYNNSTTRKDGYSSLSLHNFGVKSRNFDSVASVSSNKAPKGMEWMLNGDPISLGASDSEFQCMMHNKVGLNTEPQYLNSFALYNSGVLDQQNQHPLMFLNPLDYPRENLQSQKPRGFIDAWSNTGSEESNGNNTNNKSSVASIGKFSLDLSMRGDSVHEDIGTTIDMGLGLMEHNGNNNTQHNDAKTHLSNWLARTPTSTSTWVASTTLGGPLAEVLRLSNANATNDGASNPSSHVITYAESSRSSLETLVSSPSGVLHQTLASFSDSSSNSSPRVASSRTSISDIAMLRFIQK
ncbi:putative transcription factor interactor and regulator C3H-WRC/GRF family [Lupinus albus]|uniref:Growth-regulating factor n=1 Tax=Lupinus albus TaxID=3870 RepID=A0A6A4NL39_LUPAL|nr:putative transcription factor interactor and regulator C3H-WRC/GRF family [Lupinus albus]